MSRGRRIIIGVAIALVVLAAAGALALRELGRQTRRTKSGSAVASIYLSLEMYAYDHKGRFPDRFGPLGPSWQPLNDAAARDLLRDLSRRYNSLDAAFDRSDPLLDGWRRPLRISVARRISGDFIFKVESAGEDGQFGTPDDVARTPDDLGTSVPARGP